MNKKMMNEAFDRSLAERIQMVVNDPDFPIREEWNPHAAEGLPLLAGISRHGGAKRLVRELWQANDWHPAFQPTFVLRALAASELHKHGHILESTSDDGSADYADLFELSSGFWDRGLALESVVGEPVFHRFQTYGLLFDFGEVGLRRIADEALELVESMGCVNFSYPRSELLHMPLEDLSSGAKVAKDNPGVHILLSEGRLVAKEHFKALMAQAAEIDERIELSFVLEARTENHDGPGHSYSGRVFAQYQDAVADAA